MVHFVFIVSSITRYKTVVKKLLLIGDKITASWKTSNVHNLQVTKLQTTNYKLQTLKHWKAEVQTPRFSYFAVPGPAPLFLGFLPFSIAIF